MLGGIIINIVATILNFKPSSVSVPIIYLVYHIHNASTWWLIVTSA